MSTQTFEHMGFIPEARGGIMSEQRAVGQVAKVNPDLVVCDEKGRPFTVRYDEVNAMLLNEFLKEHRKVEEQQATIAELKSVLAQQKKAHDDDIMALRQSLKAQAAQIEKVSDQLAVSQNAPATLVDNR